MRKGFTIIELIVVVTILPIAMLVISKMFNTFMLEIPKSYKIANENTVLLNLLKRFQQDIDQARQLPESIGGNTVSDNLLFIERPDGVICYKIEAGRVHRYVLSDAGDIPDKSKDFWVLPKTNIQWKILERDGRKNAVEVQTYIEYNVHGRFEKRLANSHLYCIGVL